MAKAHNSTVSAQLAKPHTLLITLLVIALVAVSAALFVVNGRLDGYKTLTSVPNQACVGLSNGVISNKAVNIIAKSSLKQNNADNMTAAFTCYTGQGVDAATIQGKHIGSYLFGAQALYFKDAAAAKQYAAKKVNPLRYWGVNQAGQDAGIPQTSIFSFIVIGGPIPPYYDAYTVSGNAVLRISLPCGDTDVSQGGVACYAEAQSAIETFARSIVPLNL